MISEDKPLKIFLFDENRDRVEITKVGEHKITTIETVTIEGKQKVYERSFNYKSLNDVVNYYGKFGFTVGVKD